MAEDSVVIVDGHFPLCPGEAARLSGIYEDDRAADIHFMDGSEMRTVTIVIDSNSTDGRYFGATYKNQRRGGPVTVLVDRQTGNGSIYIG